MNIESWIKKYKIVQRIEELLEWENNLGTNKYSDIYLSSERFYSSDESSTIDSVIYSIWYRKKGEEYKKYYPTLSEKSSQKKVPIWKTFFKDERMTWGGAGHIYCKFEPSQNKFIISGTHDFSYGLGDNRCGLTVKCEEKYFFDETKKVIEYWNKVPKSLGSDEWMIWAKKLVQIVDDNPNLFVSQWWKQIETSKDDGIHRGEYDEIPF